jgi:hypothetical protein
MLPIPSDRPVCYVRMPYSGAVQLKKHLTWLIASFRHQPTASFIHTDTEQSVAALYLTDSNTTHLIRLQASFIHFSKSQLLCLMLILTLHPRSLFGLSADFITKIPYEFLASHLCYIARSSVNNTFAVTKGTIDRHCGLLVRDPGYWTEMYCASCEVRTEFIYVM